VRPATSAIAGWAAIGTEAMTAAHARAAALFFKEQVVNARGALATGLAEVDFRGLKVALEERDFATTGAWNPPCS